jgi:hypothetical protein
VVDETDLPADSSQEEPAANTSDEVVNDETAQSGTDEKIEQTPLEAPTDQPATTLPALESDPLPEWEELTPEYFEDECVRGDFMLRWATILLALLLGTAYITESPVLVQVRTGQYLTENGFLPPRTDPFAVATEGQSWVNLHWLADFVIGTVQSLGGFSALTILTALKLGFSFWLLSKIGYKNVSQWWGAICAAVAVVAVFPAIQAGEMSVTILGFSVLLSLLHQWRENPTSSSLWGLPILFVLWTNMDSRAWVGLCYFALFLIMDALTKRVSKQQIIIGVTALVAGVLVSPWPGQQIFGYQNILAGAAQAQEEGLSGALFPRYAYGMTAPEFWETPDVFPIAAVVMLAFAFAALFLNASRLDWSMTLAWVGVNCLSLFMGELIPYVAIVNCVVATLQGQDWYRHRFKNDFTITGFGVFYARAGRFVTVVLFFAIAYTAANGFLMGAQGRRVGIGLGLDPRLANRLESTEQTLLPGIYGEKVFNVRADQGDMLIWLNKKPYIDSRNGLFISGKTNYAEKHRALRASLFKQGPLAGVADEGIEEVSWQDEFKALEIQSVIVRLWGRNPAYSPFLVLISSRSWPLTGFGAAGGVFTRGDVNDEKLLEHLKEYNVTNFAVQAYRINDKEKKISDTIQTWPRPVSSYDKWLVQKLDITPNKIQLARHYNVIAIRLQQALQIDQLMGLATLATRSAAEGLNLAPDNADAYRVFVDAQTLLQQAEQRFASANGQNYSLQLRSQQALCRTFQAAQASGQAPDDLRRLFVALLGQQNLDGAQNIARLYAKKTGTSITVADDSDEEAQEEAPEVLDEIETLVSQVKKQVEDARAEKLPIPQLAGIALNGRCPVMAISILEEDRTEIAKDPRLQLMYASLLLTNGRNEEAWEQLEGMQPVMEQMAIQAPSLLEQWKVSVSIANLVANVRSRPVELLGEMAESLNKQNIQALMIQPPASANPLPTMDIWPGLTSRTHYSALLEFPERWANTKLQQAIVLLDQGDLKLAKTTLEEIYEGHPEYSLRSLVVLYLALLTGEEYELEPPSARIPIWGDMFTPEGVEEENQTPVEMKTPEGTEEPKAPESNSGNLPPMPILPEPFEE